VAVVDVQTGEILDHGHRTEDEWETYIREVGIENAILERARRWHEFYRDCQANHGKQGGSRFAEFAKARFGYSQQTGSAWVCIGRDAPKLTDNVSKFSADYRAFYEFTRLDGPQRQQLLNGPGKITREAITSLKRDQAEKGRSATLHEVIDPGVESGIYHGDFRKLAGQIADESVQLIFTDPPYDEDSAELYELAAKEAARILIPGGSFIAYSGHKHLPTVLNGMSKHLRYWWTFACLHSGGNQILQKLGIRCAWKPLVWFVKGTRGDVQNVIYDVTGGGGREKDTHDWQQPLEEAKAFIEKMTAPTDLVVDFFVGGGTTAIAAKDLGRRFVGFEVDAATCRKAMARWDAA